MSRLPVRAALTAAVAAVLAAPLLSAPAQAGDPALALARATAARVGTTLAEGDGPLSSANVSLVTTIPGTYIGLRRVGSHIVATGSNGVSTFDIRNPRAPKLLAVLPLPHFENEDVDSDSRIALVSNDRGSKDRGNILYVLDVRDMARPTVASALPLGDLTADERGAGHIANCVGPDSARPCDWAWLTGGRRISVVDLRTPTAPKVVAKFETPASDGSAGFGGRGVKGAGATHDVERDAGGRLWVTGSGGIAVYDARDPRRPRLLSTSGAQGTDPAVNDFVLHNSRHSLDRPGVLLATEEDYVDTDEVPPGGCRGQGKFQTWDSSGVAAGRPLRLLSQWKTELQAVPYLSGSKAPVTANCSSHWFAEHRGIVADGWYEQGLRLLDTRNPKQIRQVGYWLPPNSVTWAAYWITDSLVYTADVGRGIDVVEVKGLHGKTPARSVTAPLRASWLGAGPSLGLLRPSERWGWACGTFRGM